MKLYLFKNEYEQYKKCLYMINEYIPELYDSFWTLIYKIIDFCANEKKSYYLMFESI